MKYLILLLLFLFGNQSSIAQDGLQNGIEGFEDKNYADAIISFEEEILKSGGNSILYYNLGTAYLESKNTAKARLNLERAYLLDPLNPSIKNNLNIAIERVTTTIIPLEDFFIRRWWRSFHNAMSPTFWCILSLVFLSLTCLAIYIAWFKNGQKFRLIKPAIPIGFIVVLICIAAGISRYKYINNPSSAISMKTSKLRSSPSESSEIISTLSPGVKLKIRESLNEWIKVNTMDLEEGWIKSSDIEKI